MSAVECLRNLVNERLTAAAEEIFGVFVKTIVEYEEEIDRQRRLLDVVLKPEIKLHRTDPPQTSFVEEEVLLGHPTCNQQRNFSLGQEDSEPPEIKKEREEVCTSHDEGEQPLLQEEADTFDLTPTFDGSDHSEHQSLHSDPYQTQSVTEKETQCTTSFKWVESESDRGESAVPEPDSDHQLLSHNWPVAESQGYKTPSIGNAAVTRAKPKPFTQRHLINHTGDKPYQCLLCGKRFNVMSHLKRHTATHTGQKPHTCSTCGKSFAQKYNLKEHMMTHTGEKPYTCGFCGRGFTNNSKLKKHMTVHY